MSEENIQKEQGIQEEPIIVSIVWDKANGKYSLNTEILTDVAVHEFIELLDSVRAEVIKNAGMVNVYIFQVSECDAVVAHTLEDAKRWYKENYGLTDDDLYPDEDVKIIDANGRVYVDKKRQETATLKEIIESEWRGEPFVIFSTEV